MTLSLWLRDELTRDQVQPDLGQAGMVCHVLLRKKALKPFGSFSWEFK